MSIRTRNRQTWLIALLNLVSCGTQLYYRNGCTAVVNGVMAIACICVALMVPRDL